MNSEWQNVRLDTFANINPARRVRKGGAVSFVEMAALPQGSRDIARADVQSRIAKGAGAHFQNGDTLLARITPCLENGKTAQVRCLQEGEIAEGSTEFIVLSGVDPTDNDFVYYLCRESAFRQYAIGRMEGTSGRQRVSWQSIAAYEFDCPPPLARQQISQLLTVLDDRITLLRETNATLEAIAQAIFKSWFVDFEPVRAKMEGRTPEGMDEATAALFPDSFEESELGLVPRGGRVGKVADLGEVVCGKTPPTSNPENYGDEVPFITIPDMHDRLLVTTTKRSLSRIGADSQKKKYLPKGAICVSCIATPGLVVRVAAESQTNQQINSVVPFDLWGKSFPLFLLLRIGDAVRAGGSGGSVFHNLSKSGFEELRVILTAPAIARRFDEIVEPLVARIEATQHQAQTLATLRDTLLPRLISGQLRLPEAENAIAEAIA